jgi:hypothetical protein
MLALTGALIAAIAVLALPGAVGHAGQTAPRGIAVPRCAERLPMS